MLQILIRHGESLSNREGRVQGQANVKLSDTGRRQAAAVAAWCKSQSFPNQSCELWSSPLWPCSGDGRSDRNGNRPSCPVGR